MNKLETVSSGHIHIPGNDLKVLEKLAAVVAFLAAVIPRPLCIICEKS